MIRLDLVDYFLDFLPAILISAFASPVVPYDDRTRF